MHDGIRRPVPSVTGILKVLDKPALLAWAEACGAEGAAFLAAQGELDGVDPAEAIYRVRMFKAGMDAKRDAGADRGLAVHTVQEMWMRDRTVPVLSSFPLEVRGFVKGYCSFLLEHNPQPSSIERVVGSREHGYAGRMDMRAVIGDRDVVVDLKTSAKARIYDEAHLQSRSYAMADVECGAPEPDGIVLVAVGADGSYEVTECQATAEDFLNVLATYQSLRRLRDARKKAAS